MKFKKRERFFLKWLFSPEAIYLCDTREWTEKKSLTGGTHLDHLIFMSTSQVKHAFTALIINTGVHFLTYR